MGRNSRKKVSILKALPDFRSGVEKAEPTTVRRERGRVVKRSKRLLTGFAAFAVFVVVIWAFQATRITEVKVYETTQAGAFVPVDTQAVESTIDAYLNESFLNRWRLNEPRLIEQVLAAHQSVAGVQEITSGAGKLDVGIAARKRAVVWVKADRLYEVDTAGVVFKDVTEGDVDAVRVRDETKLPVSVGEPVAVPRFMAQIDAIANQDAQEEAFQVESFIAPEQARELHFKIQNQPFTVKTMIDANPAVISASIVDSLDYFAENNTTPSDVLDLRVPGRAVYR